MNREQKEIRARFTELIHSPLHRFPADHGKIKAPTQQGVYLIYSPRDKVLRIGGNTVPRDTLLHAGRTIRGIGGIRQRLNNHLHDASSFTNQFLKHDGSKLRNGCTYRYLEIEDARLRALVEAYAVGYLCPKHIGLGQVSN
jgi:hypothetical protein